MDITFEQIKTAVVVILALLGVVATVMNAIDAVHKLRKPGSDRQKKIDEKLDNDKARLDAHERELAALRDGQRVICSGVQALLDHELHNGNADQMQDASNKLTSWLINK